MSLEAGIYQLLAAAPSLTALQGTRVYPVILPDGPLPATTYQIVGGSGRPTFTGTGPQRRRVQFDFWADYENGTYDQAIALRDATIKLLNQFTGALPNGFVLLLCDYLQSIDHFDNDARRYRCTAEFYFTFNL